MPRERLTNMKTLILLIAVMFVSTGASMPTMKSVAGAFEGENDDGDIIRILLLENGIGQGYTNGEKDREGKWKIVGDEIHASNEEGTLYALRINEDSSITLLAVIDADGERTGLPKDKQTTYKKSKD